MCFRSPGSAYVCSRILSLMTLRIRMTQLRTPHTKELRRLRRMAYFPLFDRTL
jgi:hypothetical protein